jgi:hypothetical protein
VRCKASISSIAGFERDSLQFGFGIGFRVCCDFGKDFLRLLRLRPQVENEFDLVTWATGSVESPGCSIELVRTCGQCGDRRLMTLSKRRRRERLAQGICVPGVGPIGLAELSAGVGLQWGRKGRSGLLGCIEEKRK